MVLLFTITFTFGVMIGMIVHHNFLKHTLLEEKQSIKEEVSEKSKRKDIRDFCINLTHYTPEQLKEVYELLRLLKEPIFNHGDWKPMWYEKDCDFRDSSSVIEMDYLAFGKSGQWVMSAKFEATGKKVIELHDFLIMLRIKLIERENPRYQLWEHMRNEHNLTLLDSEIDEIIYHVNKINHGYKK